MSEYILINHCQICNNPTQEVLSLGNLPLVDGLIDPLAGLDSSINRYPVPLLYCPFCQLVQLGCIVDKELLFPLDYPYRSGTTKILRDNFTDLVQELKKFITLNKNDLVVDVGCNDGTLLDNFKNDTHVLGVTPENMGQLAVQKGIKVIQSYFTPETSQRIFTQYGHATVITATNVLAHFKHIDDALQSIKQLLKPEGLFISESGYLFSMLEGLQYDSIHHEHLRYYSLMSLKYLFNKHGFEIIHAKRIATHGGSIRIYAAHQGQYPVNESVSNLSKEEEKKNLNKEALNDFRLRVDGHKFELYQLLSELKKAHKTIQGISAPGRATVLMNYVGIDNSILDNVYETEGSYKIGKIIPGTKVMVLSERELFMEQPDFCLILSWHIANELMRKLKSRGFRGDFILPLPKAVIIRNQDI
jgi:SAM-dependent methyltransferase